MSAASKAAHVPVQGLAGGRLVRRDRMGWRGEAGWGVGEERHVRGSSHAPKQRAKCVWPREVGFWHPWSQLVIDMLPIDCPDRRWSGPAGLVASKSCVWHQQGSAHRTYVVCARCCCVLGTSLPPVCLTSSHDLHSTTFTHVSGCVPRSAQWQTKTRFEEHTAHEKMGGAGRERPDTDRSRLQGAQLVAAKCGGGRNWTSTNHTKAWPLRQGTHAGGVVSYGGGAVTSFIFTVGPAWQRPSSAAHTARARPTPVMATSLQLQALKVGL
jgi:hypothetical protein